MSTTNSDDRAMISIFFKSETEYSGSGPYVFINNYLLDRIPPRGAVSLELSTGSMSASLNGLKSGLSFTEWANQDLTLFRNEHRFFVYDQTIGVMSEVRKDMYNEILSLYPVVEREKKDAGYYLSEAAFIVALPIILPGIVIYSLVTWQPVQ